MHLEAFPLLSPLVQMPLGTQVRAVFFHAETNSVRQDVYILCRSMVNESVELGTILQDVVCFVDATT